MQYKTSEVSSLEIKNQNLRGLWALRMNDLCIKVGTWKTIESKKVGLSSANPSPFWVTFRSLRSSGRRQTLEVVTKTTTITTGTGQNSQFMRKFLHNNTPIKIWHFLHNNTNYWHLLPRLLSEFLRFNTNTNCIHNQISSLAGTG